MKIIRSVPSTLRVVCQNQTHAEGVRDGIILALQNIQHECDIIMRKMPEIETREDGTLQVYARFTARSKRNGRPEGSWYKTESAYYEENEEGQKVRPDQEEVGLTGLGFSYGEVSVVFCKYNDENTMVIRKKNGFNDWLNDQRMTTENKTIGQTNRELAHKRLDQFFDEKEWE